MRFATEPDCWRQFSGPGGRRLVLKPDAFIVWTSNEFEDRYFIELDRSTESLPRITAKAQMYARHWQGGSEQYAQGIYPQVLWITPDDKRSTQIVTALTRIDPELWSLFAVTTAERAATQISRRGST
jgi:hypothetical protein